MYSVCICACSVRAKPLFFCWRVGVVSNVDARREHLPEKNAQFAQSSTRWMAVAGSMHSRNRGRESMLLRPVR